ncbi:MAG TPA: RNA methyltransferase [Sphingobacteriaceae bacterium]
MQRRFFGLFGMLSKSEISFIKSLHLKKYRKDHNLFIAEGFKSVSEFINSDYTIETIYCTAALLPKLYKFSRKIKLVEITEAEISKVTALTTPQGVLATIRIPTRTEISAEGLKNAFTLVLDGVQDPGNLGTIIRTADWFGFTQILCSGDTVEVYNPKVVQATMGSLSRMKIHYTDLEKTLSTSGLPIFGALLNGTSVYEVDFGKEGLIVLGNEGKGITPAVQQIITEAVTIPRFGDAESLNVAVSSAIFCSEIKRKSIK